MKWGRICGVFWREQQALLQRLSGAPEQDADLAWLAAEYAVGKLSLEALEERIELVLQYGSLSAAKWAVSGG